MPEGADTLSPQPTFTTEPTPDKPAIGGAPGASIRPFRFEASQADLDVLRKRILATRWPERETLAVSNDLRAAIAVGTQMGSLGEIKF